MRGAAIDDEKDRALRAGDQALQEREDSGIDAPFFDDHQPHMATRIDRRNQARGGGGRRSSGRSAPATFAPSAPRRVIGFGWDAAPPK